PLQRQSLDSFQKAYNEKTKSSKAQTQAARSFMADPRVVTGFKPVIKEMIYPILVNKSKGSELWDIDGNHYVDMLNGFGSNFFGYSPDFITKALKEQIDSGYELGPQHPLAIEASALATELTGWDRVAWCNTGSEAVLGAMRIARTVTGRTRIASFTGSYHGINDEVIIRGTKQLRPLAAAPGIMTAAVQNMLVLDYGTDEALKILREQCKDLAAILVEPVQSRRPEFRPIEFLKELRKITEEHGTLLIFDEVITGFRYHPGGFAASVGIQPDLGTYGKVVGGGMPIGMIGGKRQFIDALDGGHWNFGDSSIPEVGVTYFAGTFVRHPLALAAAVATMQKLKADGPALQDSVNKKADRYCSALNAIFKKYDAPYFYANFGSLMKLKINDDAKGYPELLATWLRNKGVHIWDSFPTFITCAHTDEQIDWVIKQFEDSIREMQMGGLLGEVSQAQTAQYYTDFGMKVAPAHPQAKLGVDESGQAAWFIPDPDRPGKFKQIVVD
ncbi:MAG: aminotransferase class III-fold pyridoxal phosphate-dependent enzyme, partial [Proteobacteria bacterium]